MAAELKLMSKINEGVTKEGKEYSFRSYFTTINGIELQLKPVDRTCQSVLQDHFEMLELK